MNVNTLDDALRALQAALFGRELYDAGHPFVREQMERGHALLVGLLVDQDSIQLLILEDRLVSGNDSLPSSPGLLSGAFGRFAKFHVDCLTFHRGLQCAELYQLFDQISEQRAREAAEHGETLELQPSAHIRLGHISAAQLPSTEIHTIGLGDAQQYIPALQNIWGQVVTGGAGFGDTLGSVVAEISAAVSTSQGMLLPLASLKSHDEYTFVHTINVGILASALGEAAGLSGDLLQDLTAAALLHDIGKRFVPRTLLHKTGKLTASEMQLVQRHPELGAGLLVGLPNVPDMAVIVAYEHHMQLTGGGYPHVKRPQTLSTASQIVQIADIFDALRTNRPYRDALSNDESLEIMEKQAGVSFDRVLYELFLKEVVGRADRSDKRRAA